MKMREANLRKAEQLEKNTDGKFYLNVIIVNKLVQNVIHT